MVPLFAVLGGCSVGKDPNLVGGGSLIINPRLQMVVTRLQIQPIFTVGSADHIPSEEYNVVMFLSLPTGAVFGSGGGGSVDGTKALDTYGWTGGTISIACDYSKKTGKINGQPFKLADGNVLLVSLDEKGMPSVKSQFADSSKYPRTKANGGSSSFAPDDFLALLRQMYPAVTKFIQANGGFGADSKSKPGAPEK
jgi:hypothetical protein